MALEFGPPVSLGGLVSAIATHAGTWVALGKIGEWIDVPYGGYTIYHSVIWWTDDPVNGPWNLVYLPVATDSLAEISPVYDGTKWLIVCQQPSPSGFDTLLLSAGTPGGEWSSEVTPWDAAHGLGGLSVANGRVFLLGTDQDPIDYTYFPLVAVTDGATWDVYSYTGMSTCTAIAYEAGTYYMLGTASESYGSFTGFAVAASSYPSSGYSSHTTGSATAMTITGYTDGSWAYSSYDGLPMLHHAASAAGPWTEDLMDDTLEVAPGVNLTYSYPTSIARGSGYVVTTGQITQNWGGEGYSLGGIRWAQAFNGPWTNALIDAAPTRVVAGQQAFVASDGSSIWVAALGGMTVDAVRIGNAFHHGTTIRTA